MSDTVPNSLERLNLDEIIARIERQQAETRKLLVEGEKLHSERDKLAAEASKLASERDKLTAEIGKLVAEAGKLNRDRFFAPFAIGCATLTAIAALAPSIIRALGG